MHRAPGRRSLAGIAAICLVGVAAALVLQPVGCNQTAHLGLVKALTDGAPRIDAYAAETCDTAYIDGHYYAAKAPGLALATVPWYGTLRLAGLAVGQAARASSWPEAMLELPRRATWQVSIVGATLAALLLLLLVRGAADMLVPGYGAAAAVMLGTGSLVLPFSTLFFAHVLAWLAAARVGAAAAAGVLLLAALLAPGVSSHSKWALLVVLASGAIVGLSVTRMAPRT